MTEATNISNNHDDLGMQLKERIEPTASISHGGIMEGGLLAGLKRTALDRSSHGCSSLTDPMKMTPTNKIKAGSVNKLPKTAVEKDDKMIISSMDVDHEKITYCSALMKSHGVLSYDNAMRSPSPSSSSSCSTEKNNRLLENLTLNNSSHHRNLASSCPPTRGDAGSGSGSDNDEDGSGSESRAEERAKLASMLEQATQFAAALDKINQDFSREFNRDNSTLSPRPAAGGLGGKRRRAQRRNSFVMHRSPNSMGGGGDPLQSVRNFEWNFGSNPMQNESAGDAMPKLASTSNLDYFRSGGGADGTGRSFLDMGDSTSTDEKFGKDFGFPECETTSLIRHMSAPPLSYMTERPTCSEEE